MLRIMRVSPVSGWRSRRRLAVRGAGSLAPAQFEQWVIAPTARIVAEVRQRHPDVPIIGFPKGAGGKLPAYARETEVDAIGLDETVDPAWAATARMRSISAELKMRRSLA